MRSRWILLAVFLIVVLTASLARIAGLRLHIKRMKPAPPCFAQLRAILMAESLTLRFEPQPWLNLRPVAIEGEAEESIRQLLLCSIPEETEDADAGLAEKPHGYLYCQDTASEVVVTVFYDCFSPASGSDAWIVRNQADCTGLTTLLLDEARKAMSRDKP